MKKFMIAAMILAALGLAGFGSLSGPAQGEDPVPALAQGTSGSPLVGFETGNTMEMASADPDGYLDTTVVRPGSGSFCYRAGGGACVVLGGMSAAAVSARFSWRTSDVSLGAQIFFFTAAGAKRTPPQTQVYFTLDGRTGRLYAASSKVGLNGGQPVYGQTALANDTWYTIRVAYDAAAGGVVRLWVDEVLDIDTTHSIAGASVADARISGRLNSNNYFDDFWIGDSAAAPPFGQIVRLAPNGGPVVWDNSGGFVRVDEIVPLGGTGEENVQMGINDATELYDLEDLAAASAVNAVKAMWQMKRGLGKASDHRYAWFEGGVFDDSGPISLPQSGYANFSRVFELAPSGYPWDMLRLNGFQIGARHASGPQDTFISWATVMVDHFQPF